MLPDNNRSTKNSSSFLSLFSRKKRSNKSVTELLDENKKIASAPVGQFLKNGKVISYTSNTDINGNGTWKSSENMVPLQTKEFQPSQQPLYQQQQQQQLLQQELLQQQAKLSDRTDFIFPDNKWFRNNSHKHQQLSTEEPVPTQSSTVPNVRSKSESRNMTERSPILLAKKASSVDAVNHRNPGYLMEALETLADVQPRVARSIPKHAIVDTSNFAARSLDNCLFDATVYDAMLHDSIKVCEMLQNHLNQCIATARTNCSNEYLQATPEENEEETQEKGNRTELNNSTDHPPILTTYASL